MKPSSQLYPFQDLEWAEEKISTMFLADHGIIGIFSFMRKQSRWKAIGDYPILAFICSIGNLLKIPIEKEKLTYVLEHSSEKYLKRNCRNEELINQLLSS